MRSVVMPGTAEVRRSPDGSAAHAEGRKTKTVSIPVDKLASSRMARPFRIPKRKSPDDRCTQMESPLSRLQDSHVQKMQWTQFSGIGRRFQGFRPLNENVSSNHSPARGNINVGGMHARLVLTDILKTELGSEYLNSGRSCPKRASDTLCQDRSLPNRVLDKMCQGASQSLLSGTVTTDRKQAHLKDTAQPPRVGKRERAMPEGLKNRKSSSGSENSEVENKEKEKRRATLGRSNRQVENAGDEHSTIGVSRGSVLRHSGERMGRRVIPKHLAVEELQGRAPSADSVGEECLARGPDPQTPSKPWDREKKTSPKLSTSSTRPKKPKLSATEPIVLSSDDDSEEEKDEPVPPPPHVRVLLPSSSMEPQSEHHPEEQKDTQARDEELLPYVGSEEIPGDMSPIIVLSFSSLNINTLRVGANGNITITNDCITIPLKDSSGVVDVAVALVTSEVRRYGVWDGSVLCDWEGPAPPPALLFLWVSDAQAQLVQAELSAIHPVQQPGLASPFLLLSLTDSLEGLQGVLLASFMEMLALKCWAQDLMRPLSWSQGVAMIRRSGQDPYLLSLLGQNSEPAQTLEEQTEPHLAATEQESPARPTPTYTLCHCRIRSLYSVSIAPRPGPTWTCHKPQRPPRRLIVFPPPPSKGGILVTTEDLECLDSGEFLNDVIIDFYLKYLMMEKAPKAVAERSHVFSSFFLNQLTRKDHASEESSCYTAQVRRHHRVKTWTRHIDIFSKDYVFVPVNQDSHWYLVVICFPGLLEPEYEKWSISGLRDPGTARNCQEQLTYGTEGDRRRSAHSVPECTQLGCQRKTVCKRPCILVMDSLKLSYHERVLKLLREYLQVEWKVRRGTSRDFTTVQMKGTHCRVPLQDNSSDCGVYLLQYVESFVQNPVVHFDLPLHLGHWFPRQQVRRKRDEIRDMVLQLHRKQQCGKVWQLPHLD
ncbi:hypothetical protein AAFF_G00194590 [Aldrovandia affinis]|uniref:Ubiquitin-like protease family profile domain-containing protein n=1 Tax=Aldrovandia affinis TaxID=143900 RepID=A0AAD7SXI0_9TELE|nr:hypothetical protein AAFF_G00194590 [Aldrovandia affinis]